MEGYHAGEKSDPAADTLITIQYQKIDLATGEPLEKLTILKEWESSEKSIVTTFYNQFFNPEVRVTHFIPVGINLDYAYEMIIAKCKKYNLPPVTSHQLYYERPRLDLGPVLVLLNDGRFAGARLDTFSSKKSDSGRINKWYEKKEFKPIEHTLQDEAESFLKLFQYLSKYKTRLGITRKGETSPRETCAKNTPPPLQKRHFPLIQNPRHHLSGHQRNKQTRENLLPIKVRHNSQKLNPGLPGNLLRKQHPLISDLPHHVTSSSNIRLRKRMTGKSTGRNFRFTFLEAEHFKRFRSIPR